MTKDADSDFRDPGYAPLEATRSAFRVHKRLLYYECAHPELFLEPVTADQEAFEARLLDEQSDLEDRVGALMGAGNGEAARALLTAYTGARLLAGLELGEALVTRVEGATRSRFGIEMPAAEVPEGASWRPESEAMTQRSGQTYHRCLMEDHVGGYPRRHGTYASLA